METISIALACTLLGVTFGYINFQRNKTKDTKEETGSFTKMAEEVKYISKGVDDIKYDTRNLSKTMSEINERLVRCEESTKSAHKRIDSLEEGK